MVGPSQGDTKDSKKAKALMNRVNSNSVSPCGKHAHINNPNAICTFEGNMYLGTKGGHDEYACVTGSAITCQIVDLIIMC